MSTIELVPNAVYENSQQVIDAFYDGAWFRENVKPGDFARFIRIADLKDGDKVRVTYLRSLDERTHDLLDRSQVDFRFSVSFTVQKENEYEIAT